MAILPERDGIPPSRVYLPEGPWERLLDFLSERFPRIPSSILVRRLEEGEIVNDQGVAQTADTPYRAGQWLWYYREVPDEVAVPFDLPVLYRDDRLVAVDKPHFMASTPGGQYLRNTALVRLRRELGISTLAPMHRLDRDTAGVLVFSIEPRWRGQYQKLFQSREVYKEYLAVAEPPSRMQFPYVHRSRLEEVPGGFVMRECPGAPNSETRIEHVKVLGGRRSLLRLIPSTGKKHQLRAHLSALGMPILNDAYYPSLRPEPPHKFDRPLQLLACVLEFRDPVDGRVHRFETHRTLAADEVECRV